MGGCAEGGSDFGLINFLIWILLTQHFFHFLFKFKKIVKYFIWKAGSQLLAEGRSYLVKSSSRIDCYRVHPDFLSPPQRAGIIIFYSFIGKLSKTKTGNLRSG